MGRRGDRASPERRTTMMQGEKIAADLREGAGRPSAAPIRRSPAACRAAVAPAGATGGKFAGAGRARGEGDRRPRSTALEEADQHLNAALVAADFDPGELERHRGAAVRLARGVAQIFDAGRRSGPRWPRQYTAADVALIDAGADQFEKSWRRQRPRSTKRYSAAARKTASAARTKSRGKTNSTRTGPIAELAPLKA